MGEVSIINKKTEEIQNTVEGVEAHVEELGDDVQDLRKLCSVSNVSVPCR